MVSVELITINFYIELSAGMRLAFAMVYDVEEIGGKLRESSCLRDTLRLFNFWGDGPVGLAVSIVESVKESSTFLRSNFASRFFIEDLDSHVEQHNLERCITEIILDYMWMPDNWTMTNYGSHNFGLLENILILAGRNYPLSHIKVGGIVYLPIPWQFYHGIVMSDHWENLTRIFNIEYIDFKDAELNPLVRSDMTIKESIAMCGKDVEYNLELLTNKGEKISSFISCDLYHWRGSHNIFMKLTCTCRNTIPMDWNS